MSTTLCRHTHNESGVIARVWVVRWLNGGNGERDVGNEPQLVLVPMKFPCWMIPIFGYLSFQLYILKNVKR